VKIIVKGCPDLPPMIGIADAEEMGGELEKEALTIVTDR